MKKTLTKVAKSRLETFKTELELDIQKKLRMSFPDDSGTDSDVEI